MRKITTNPYLHLMLLTALVGVYVASFAPVDADEQSECVSQRGQNRAGGGFIEWVGVLRHLVMKHAEVPVVFIRDLLEFGQLTSSFSSTAQLSFMAAVDKKFALGHKGILGHSAMMVNDCRRLLNLVSLALSTRSADDHKDKKDDDHITKSTTAKVGSALLIGAESVSFMATVAMLINTAVECHHTQGEMLDGAAVGWLLTSACMVVGGWLRVDEVVRPYTDSMQERAHSAYSSVINAIGI